MRCDNLNALRTSITEQLNPSEGHLAMDPRLPTVLRLLRMAPFPIGVLR